MLTTIIKLDSSSVKHLFNYIMLIFGQLLNTQKNLFSVNFNILLTWSIVHSKLLQTKQITYKLKEIMLNETTNNVINAEAYLEFILEFLI